MPQTSLCAITVFVLALPLAADWIKLGQAGVLRPLEGTQLTGSTADMNPGAQCVLLVYCTNILKWKPLFDGLVLGLYY